MTIHHTFDERDPDPLNAWQTAHPVEDWPKLCTVHNVNAIGSPKEDKTILALFQIAFDDVARQGRRRTL